MDSWPGPLAPGRGHTAVCQAYRCSVLQTLSAPRVDILCLQQPELTQVLGIRPSSARRVSPAVRCPHPPLPPMVPLVLNGMRAW